MNYCIANIINCALIKSFHNVHKAKLERILKETASFLQASIHFHPAESTLWTAHRPKAESRNGKQQPGCILDWANNVAGPTSSPRKPPLIRPLHVHPCQHLKKRQEEKVPLGLRRCWHRF